MSTFSSASEANPFGFVVGKGMMDLDSNVQNFERLAATYGVDCARSLFERTVENNRLCLELQMKCVGMQYGYSRSLSSGASSPRSVGSFRSGSPVSHGPGDVPLVGRSVGVPVSAGLALARANSINRLKTWRKSVVPDGMCSAKLMREGVSESRLVDLGPHPTLASLMRLSAAVYKPLSELASARLIMKDAGQAHVTMGGSEGLPLLPAFKSYAGRAACLPGSFGELLRGSDVGPSVSSVVVKGGCRIGTGSASAGLSEAEAGLLSDGLGLPVGALRGLVPLRCGLEGKGLKLGVLDDGKAAFLFALEENSRVRGFLPVKPGTGTSDGFDVLKAASVISEGKTFWFSLEVADDRVLSGSHKVHRVWNPLVFLKAFSGWNTTTSFDYSEFKRHYSIRG